QTPGQAGQEVIARALAKLENAVGEPAPVAVATPEQTSRLAPVRDAVASGRALEITYYSAASDRISTRVVDPLRVVVVGGKGYLEAWCRSAGAVRRFRVDRIDRLTVLDEPAAPPPAARPGPVGPGIFAPGPELPLVTLRVGRPARWIAEYYPCEHVDDSGDEWLVSLRVTDLAWAQRLVLRLAPDVAVVAPAELAERVRQRAARALEAYATPTGLAPPVTDDR